MKAIQKTLMILSVLALVSCEKHKMDNDDDDLKPCPSVNCDAVPSDVQSAFKTKYPSNTAEQWFNQDNKGFAALFTQNGTKTLAQFDNNGTFKTENVAPTSPSSSTPSSGGFGHGQCACHPGGHHHHPHHPGFLRPFHHKHQHNGNCQREHSKERECHVVLEN